VSATSRQPLSIVSAWPRFAIFTISVTPLLRAWSPDRSLIAYARNTSDSSQLFVVRLSNGASTMVTQEPQGVVGPGGWAPDGGSIVFATPDYTINHYSALSVDLATGESRPIVPDGSSPTLSPDGALIAFNSWTKPDPLVRLILANADGSERRVIARLMGGDGYQRWSPDSTQIAYVERTPMVASIRKSTISAPVKRAS
jgi:Tol biopolymer transport system component